MIDISEHGGLYGGSTTSDFPKWYLKKHDKWATGEKSPFTTSDGITVSTNKKIYIFCADIGGSYTTAAYVFDTENYTFQSIAPSLSQRDQAAAALYQDRYAYVIGGRYNNAAQSTVECYDILTNTWSTKAPMPKGAIFPTACVIDNYIYVMGGTDSSDSFYRYDIIANIWTTLPVMPFRTYSAPVYVYGSKIYIFTTSTTHFYDILTGTWTTKTAPPTAFSSSRAGGLIDGKVYIFDNSQTLCYDILTDTWTAKKIRHNTGLAAWTVGQTNKHIYSFGGRTGSITRFNDVEVYFA